MCRSGLLAVLLCACVAPAQEPAAPAAGAGVLRPSSQAPTPGEEIAPGRALVELLTPLSLPPVEVVEGALPVVIPAPMREIGGVPVRVLRSIYPGAGAGDPEDAGPQLLLVATSATDEAGTRAHL